jgi:hypothetical protein
MSFLDNSGTKSHMTERVPKIERCSSVYNLIQNNKQIIVIYTNLSSRTWLFLWLIYYPQFPPKLSRLSEIPAKTLTTESVLDWVRAPSLAGWTSLIKTLPVRVRIFDVCQEHLTGFDLISQSRSTRSKLWNHQMIIHDHHKYWTFSVKTLNFVMRIVGSDGIEWVIHKFSP